jgi:hypothetical protein
MEGEERSEKKRLGHRLSECQREREREEKKLSVSYGLGNDEDRIRICGMVTERW